MSTPPRWRARLPDLADALDDPRVHAALVDPHGHTELRAADGSVLDRALPTLKPAAVRALAKEASDRGLTITPVPTRGGMAVHLARRSADLDKPIDAPLGGLIEPSLTSGASILVVGPRAAIRAEVVAAVARQVRARRRILALDPRDPRSIEPAALAGLGAIDDALLVAGDLPGLDAGLLLRSPIPCLASMPGLSLESGVARLAGQVALERPGLGHASVASAIAGRFDLAIETDDHRIVAVAEVSLEPRADHTLVLSRIAVRAPGGTFELTLGGSRVERRLTGILEGAHSPSARPERAPPRARTAPSRVSPPASSSAVRGPVLREAPDPPARQPFSQRETQELSAHDPSEARLPSTQGPRGTFSGRLAPLVDPPPMSSPARAAISGHSGMRDGVEPTGEFAPAGLSPLGRLQLDQLSELTPDQLVSQSFIVDVGYHTPEAHVLSDAPPAESQPPLGDFDERTSSGEPSAPPPPQPSASSSRAPLERQSTEIADAKSGSLASPLSPHVIGFGEQTMQIPASMLRPPAPTPFVDENTIDPGLGRPLVAPPALDPDPEDEPHASRTAYGLLAQDDDPPAPARGVRRGRRES